MVDIIDIWRLIIQGWKVMVATTCFGVVLAYTAVLVSSPKYAAEATIIPANRDTGAARSISGLGSVAGLIGLGGNVSSDTSQALATLKSREFATQFFSKYDALRQLLPEYWDASAKEWKPRTRSFIGKIADTLGLSTARTHVDPLKPDVQLALKRFDQARTISVDKDTGIVTIRIEWTDPIVARDWVNGIVSLLNAELRKKAINESRLRVDYLQNEIEKTHITALREALTNVIENELKKSMMANVDEDYAFDVIDPAIAPERSTKPRPVVLLILGVIGGALIGVFYILFRHYIRALAQSKSNHYPQPSTSG